MTKFSCYYETRGLLKQIFECRVGNLEYFRILNVVASTKLDVGIDLEELSIRLKNVEYDTQIWSGLVWRREDPKSTIIMFSTGKLASVGTRSEKEAKIAIQKALQSIPELSNAHYSEPTIENVVAMTDLRHTLSLEKVAENLESSIYEPDQFPGLIHRAEGVTFLIFATGKICVVGGKSEKQVEKAMENLLAKIKSVSKENW